MPSIYILICYLVGTAFLWAGWMNVSGHPIVRVEFGQWGYPRALGIGVGLAEWLAAILLMSQFEPRIGILIGIAVLLGVIGTLIKFGERLRVEYPLVLMSMLIIIWPSSPVLTFF